MGFAIAEVCADAGAEVILVSGPVSLETKNKSIRLIRVETAAQMHSECLNYFSSCHAAILSAGAENVERINSQAESFGIMLRTDVFASRECWQDYAVNALRTVERLAAEVGVADRLHLWPDKSLGNVGVANRMPKPKEYLRWLRNSWERISEWPR